MSKERKEYQVWTCKIIIPGGAKIPKVFDTPPRQGAISAVKSYGIKVIGCFSGWGGTLTETQYDIVAQSELEPPQDDPVYFIGTEEDKNTFRN